jgi:hypothetical protein
MTAAAGGFTGAPGPRPSVPLSMASSLGPGLA